MAVAGNEPSRTKGPILSVIGLLGGLLLGTCALAQGEWRFSDVDRIVAVADIHGAYGAFERILKRAAVIDESLSWTGGSTHLVIVGDVLDRGADSRLALDLIRKLEAEAPESGGRVHLVLGNHEIMNMTGDLRYVSAGEFAAFAEDESREMREDEFDRLVRSLGDADADDIAAARQQFDADFPPGFFAHRLAYSVNGQYGGWLLEKPVLLVVNDMAFVHGGLAGAAIEHASRLNERLLKDLSEFLDAYERLISASLLSRAVDLYDLPARASELLEGSHADAALPDELRADAVRLTELESLSFLLPDSPVWYRGNVGCNRLTEQDRLDSVLVEIGAEHLTIGHTPTPGLVLSRMSEKLLRIDAGMLNEYYGGRAAALVIDNDELAVLYENEDGSSRPVPQPRRVGIRPADLSAEALEAVLARAEVVGSQAFDATAVLVTLADGNLELEGMFTPSESGSVNAAVAAYRLDRLLGLDMVPVTVAREIDGTSGALQFWPQGAIDEPRRSAEGLGGSAWCPLRDQFADLYLFDALIFNQGRTPERIRYSTDNFQLLLVGHDRTFATARDRPPHLAALPVTLTPAWRAALEALDEKTLTSELGEVLDRRRIRAVLARRDHLLEIAE